jgi:hypothetical protein
MLFGHVVDWFAVCGPIDESVVVLLHDYDRPNW